MPGSPAAAPARFDLLFPFQWPPSPIRPDPITTKPSASPPVIPMNQTSILLATSNPDKQQAFRRLLEGLPLDLVTPQDLNLTSVPEEQGDNHHDVARSKAQVWSQTGSMLAVASDGGLVIPVLGGDWQSLYTHRFAGDMATDAGRVHGLIELLKPYRDAERQASWIESLAIAHRGRVLASWQVRGATGVISENAPAETLSTHGFWAFSLWEFPQLGKSYRQLSPRELESLDDHWFRLGRLVRRFFHSHFVTPAQ